MRHRTASTAGWLAAAAAIALAGSPAGQVTLSGQRGTSTSSVPRTPWGQPDLQGVWTNSTTTPLERPAKTAIEPMRKRRPGEHQQNGNRTEPQAAFHGLISFAP